MATKHYTLTITSTPILIAEGVGGDKEVYVYLSNGTGDDCFIGDESVAISGADKGYVLHKYVAGASTSRTQFTLSSTDKLYAVTGAAQTTDLSIIITNT